MDKFLDFLSNTSVILTLAAILIIAFARAIIKIFQMGATFKVQLATKDEMEAFKKEVRDEMHSYAIGVQKAVMDACMKVIDNRLMDIAEAKQTSVDIKLLKVELENEIEKVMEKYDEIKAVSDNVRALNTKVNRLEYTSASDKRNSNERRSE